ncbi:MAG: hypothetical protein RLZZ293_1369 [Pseudomonadota bacterium]|jgi:hypothetical protein
MPKYLHSNGKITHAHNKVVHGGSVKRPRDSVDKETVQPSGMAGLVGMTGKLTLNASQANKAPSSVVAYGTDLLNKVNFRDRKKKTNVKLTL